MSRHPASFLVIASVVVCAVCSASGREQAPPPPQRNPDAELLALRLSQTCSTAAETFWRRGGYDHPTTPAKGATEHWSYQSHYNTEQKRCFVLVEFLSLLPSGGSTQHEEVFDAIEGGEPLTILNVHKLAAAATPTTTLLKANATIPPTRENLEWFHGLMSK